MAIRKATNEETQTILNHALIVMKEATNGQVMLSWEKAQEFIWPFLENGGYYLVSTKNNVIQGWIAIGVSYDPYLDKMVGFINEIYVLPAYRKQGIAKELCKEARNRFRQLGYNQIQLNVFSGNPAKQLYKKLGFHEVMTLMQWNI
ncbi:GNAT family N-acetyltransferase [Caldibacillus lycopersici]|uniref:GNAT family N-acetyltransferase n=1 Tax=Perspicuibacillus lycopersici TaxID=1325689 RepID=A0AAE3IQ43_9BACI|nr:GNAT family N-acetyltransferase [Perspicuibacillus lycopersici]MCU9612346.1 GNAT family N-acetyltransferase [Perspicuibacillus lycopersici]